MPVYLFGAARRFHQVTVLSLASTAATVLGSAWLIPRFGLRGGTRAPLGGAGVLCLLSTAVFVGFAKSFQAGAARRSPSLTPPPFHFLSPQDDPG